jgi:hypothetical protein
MNLSAQGYEFSDYVKGDERLSGIQTDCKR